MTQVVEVKEFLEQSGTCWKTWKRKSGVELGVGLSLLSMVVSNLGAKVIARDSDNEVLHLLSMNAERNASSCQVEKLFWKNKK